MNAPPDDLARMHYDAVVIGAGAAGLLAAAVAAERGRCVLLLEKNTRPGVKILMSGGSRCNITQATDRRGIIDAFGRQGRFLNSALAALGPDQLVDLFHREGVETKVESTGKIFPRSDRAVDVLNALLARLERSGAELRLDQAVTDVEKLAQGFRVKTAADSFVTSRVLITSGGQSYASCGTSGDGYEWAKRLGHTIVPPRPALVPLTSEADWVRALPGVTIEDVGVRLRSDVPDAKKQLKHASRRGSFLFTHRGVSGPAVLDVSREYTALQSRAGAELVCDFLPDRPVEDVQSRWREIARESGRRSVANELRELPKRLLETLFELGNVPLDRTFAELSKAEMNRLVGQLKTSAIPLTGTLGFRKAEVTAGGVDLSEVRSKSLESKLTPGLFFAGEVLDLDGPIGGYNFQAAWSTAFLAAQQL